MANLLLATVSIRNSVNKSTQFAKEQIGGTVYLQPDTEKIREQLEQARESGEASGPLELSQPTISEELAKGIADSSYIKDYTYTVVANANASSYEVVETAQNERERQFQQSLDSARTQADEQVRDFNSQRDEFNNSQNAAPSAGPRSGSASGPGPNFNFSFDFDFSDPTLGRGDTAVQGVNSFAFISDVEDGNMKIIEGEAFDESSENSVVISTELAEANSIKVGDEIKFKRASDEAEVTLKVIGIYQTSTEDFNYNTVYTNIDSAKQFLSEEQLTELSVQNVRYYLTSAEDKDAFLAETHAQYTTLESDGLKLDIDDSSYQTMVGPIEHVGSFAMTVMWIVIVAAASIITLIVVINVKDRRYEMGVLLSVGARKRNILGQVFIELVVVGTIGFTLSLATSQAIAQKMGENVLSQQISASQQEKEESAVEGPQRGMNARRGGPVGILQQNQNDVKEIDKIDVSAGPKEYATLFGLGYLILIAALALPSINILRYQPKTILTGKE